MSLQVFLTDKTAKSITNNFDGSYDVYANENCRVFPNQVMQVKTGNIISLPLGYFPLVQPCELLNSQNIDVFNFASVHYHKYKFKKFSKSGKLEDIKSDLTELIVTIKNVGKTEHLIKKGDQIARLIITKTEIFPIKVVNKIETEIDDQEEYEIEKEIKEEREEVKKIDKNVFLWYKKTYIKNSAAILIDILNNRAEVLVENIRTSEDWSIALNKKSFEASVLWDMLAKEDRDLITQRFGKQIDEAPEVEEKTKPKKKPTRRNRMIESEEEEDDISDFD
jgi:dUTPase